MADEMSKPETKQEVVKIAQGRSPAYPYIDLEKAIERIMEINDAGAGKGSYPRETYYKIWRLGSQSSGARQTVAALKHFGLVDYVGRGDGAKIKLTDLAQKIVLDKVPGSKDRASAIRAAAMTPSIHQEMWNEYQSFLPDDVVLETFLVKDKGYNPTAATSLIAEYKGTLEFAGMDKPDETPDEDCEKLAGNIDKSLETNHSEGSGSPAVKIGTKIQWTNSGMDMFADGGTVLGLSDDGKWVFTDQGGAAVPINEVTIMGQSAPQSTQATPPEPPAHIAAAMAAAAKAKLQNESFDAKPGSRKAVFPVEDGDVILVFPENISSDGLEELGQYLNIFLKKEQKKKEAE